MASVYLETSFISACVSTRTDAASIYRRETSVEWWERFRSKHQLVVSPEVWAELGAPTYPNRQQAIVLIAGLPSIEITPEVLGFAGVLVAHQVMPAPIGGDSVHVSAAAVTGQEYILSWNVKHLANASKLRHLAVICSRHGYRAPQIVTPELLWE